MGCGFEPHLKQCVVFLNMTLNILCSVLVPPPPPMKSEGYCFGVGRLCTRLSVCLSVCPPILPETYLSTYWSDLVHSLHEWIVPWTVPSADPEGGQGVRTAPGKSQIGRSNWNPHPGKSWTPPGKCWTPSGTLKNDSLTYTICSNSHNTIPFS